MRRQLLGLVLLAFAATAAVAQPARREVVLTNHTGHAMIQFFASSVAAHDWQEDRLGPVLADGQSRRVVLTRAGPCQFDLKAVLDDGRSIERRGVDVCATPNYTFEG